MKMIAIGAALLAATTFGAGEGSFKVGQNVEYHYERKDTGEVVGVYRGVVVRHPQLGLSVAMDGTSYVIDLLEEDGTVIPANDPNIRVWVRLLVGERT